MTEHAAGHGKTDNGGSSGRRSRSLFRVPRNSPLWGRLGRSIAIWFALMSFGLAVGMAGYSGFEGMGWRDSYLNAAMILSGMGPVTELKTDGGKLFAGTYAIFSGLVIVLATGVVLSPIVQHVLHVFHADTDDDERKG
ncbi:hypothetical protein [Phreatobacter oligotrophus]|jgi:hypothetical protein|uniref:hypothetical protein n=1 Tax=Phreatobacter oligotrophus TaxID=1122261 RepID=UPI002356D17A|nr:hypothetical protein [Phreatobacter oligotrophus]MBX9990553.1 hypothetical protein [Phreatobacter oligotrophus]